MEAVALRARHFEHQVASAGGRLAHDFGQVGGDAQQAHILLFVVVVDAVAVGATGLAQLRLGGIELRGAGIEHGFYREVRHAVVGVAPEFARSHLVGVERGVGHRQ